MQTSVEVENYHYGGTPANAFNVIQRFFFFCLFFIVRSFFLGNYAPSMVHRKTANRLSFCRRIIHISSRQRRMNIASVISVICEYLATQIFLFYQWNNRKYEQPESKKQQKHCKHLYYQQDVFRSFVVLFFCFEVLWIGYTIAPISNDIDMHAGWFVLQQVFSTRLTITRCRYLWRQFYYILYLRGVQFQEHHQKIPLIKFICPVQLPWFK